MDGLWGGSPEKFPENPRPSEGPHLGYQMWDIPVVNVGHSDHVGAGGTAGERIHPKWKKR